MKTSIIQFPGLNRESDMIMALENVAGAKVETVWHTETTLPDTDLVVIPGGFSYGDYLRCGAIAARSPVMRAIVKHANKGGKVLGVCNGFQILVETGMLRGALMRNADLKFVCKRVTLSIENDSSFFTSKMTKGDQVSCPVAHHDGNYFADKETLKRLEGDGQIIFRYAQGSNPNGSLNDIAGICNAKGNIIGMMPHPENMIEPLHGKTDCRPLFESIAA